MFVSQLSHGWKCSAAFAQGHVNKLQGCWAHRVWTRANEKKWDRNKRWLQLYWTRYFFKHFFWGGRFLLRVAAFISLCFVASFSWRWLIYWPFAPRVFSCHCLPLTCRLYYRLKLISFWVARPAYCVGEAGWPWLDVSMMMIWWLILRAPILISSLGWRWP